MWRPPGAATKPRRRASRIARGVNTMVAAPASKKGPKAGIRLEARCARKARLKNASRKIACTLLPRSGERVGQREAPGEVEGALPDAIQVGPVLEPVDQVGHAVADLPHLLRPHAAGGDARRTEANP